MIVFDTAQEWRLLLYSVIVGAALGVLYDLMRISRLFMTLPAAPTSPKYYRMLSHLKLFRRTGQVTADPNDEADTRAVKVNEFAVGVVAFVEDILFFVTAALTAAVFIFHANTGDMRGFVLVGAVGGFALYLNTVGRLTLLFGELIVFVVRGALAAIYTHIITPTVKLIKRALSRAYRCTLGRLVDKHKQRKLHIAQQKRAEEIRAFCENLCDYIDIEADIKENINEFDQNEHTREARDLPGVRLSDNNIREHRNKIQQAGGGESRPRSENRYGKRKHRRAAE